MKLNLIAVLLVVSTMAGCGSYNASQVPLTEPKNQSYCQRLGDMAVGLEPYMMKEKTELVFDNELKKEEIMALSVSMIADGDREYIVSKADIDAVDEFGNGYEPVGADVVADRIDRALRGDAGLYEDLNVREMPEEVNVTGEMSQYFLYFDMSASKAESREFTVHVKADSVDGTSQKAFAITVDPMRTHMNPTERWQSYDERGVSWNCAKMETKKVEPAPAMKAADEEEVERVEKAAEKQERIFEKQLMK